MRGSWQSLNRRRSTLIPPRQNPARLLHGGLDSFRPRRTFTEGQSVGPV